MRPMLILSLLLGVAVPNCFGQTVMETQPVKELKRGNSLGSCGYKPTEKETSYFQKLEPSERTTGSFMAPYTIHGKVGKYVSWFGIMRGVRNTAPDEKMEILFEHKYFDGLTDCHVMLVSQTGGGDFHATVGPIEGTIGPLTLVRAYGKVDGEDNGIPHLSVDYIRVWPWLTFTFTDLGAGNKGNPEWEKYCRICKKGRIYDPYPDKNYYFGMLGDPKDFGTVPTEH